jgi:hypothetical protein
VSDFDGYISASQIDTFSKCQRRWHAHYVGGEPREPETDASVKGTAVHKILELYDKEGQKIDGTTELGLIAQQAEPFLFAPKSGLAEFEFNLDALKVNSPGWWTYTGKVDYLKEDGTFVRDYKTTSDFKNAKSEEDLKKNAQVILYGAVALELQNTEKRPVEFSWLYLRTKKPKALEVRFSIPAYDIKREKDNLDAYVENVMLPTRKLPLLSLPPSPDHCFAYHRPCPYRHKCTDLSALSQLKGSISSMYTNEELMARLKNGTLGGPTAPQAQPAGPQAQLPKALPKLPGAKPAEAPPPPVEEAPEEEEEGPEGAEEEVPSNPIDLLGQQMNMPRNEGEADIDYMLRLTQAKAGQAGISTEKRGRGRPPGSKNKATIEAEEKAKAKALQDAEADRLIKEAEKKAVEKANSIAASSIAPPELKKLHDEEAASAASVACQNFFPCLYVNCMPVGLDVLDFAYVAQAAMVVIQEELEVPHYSLIDYGKGKGAFLMAAKKLLDEELAAGPRPIYVDTHNSEGADCLNLLVSLSAQQVRGTR